MELVFTDMADRRPSYSRQKTPRAYAARAAAALRTGDLADSEAIERLLAGAAGSEFTLARLLPGGGQVPSLDHLPVDELAARRRARTGHPAEE